MIFVGVVLIVDVAVVVVVGVDVVASVVVIPVSFGKISEAIVVVG